jgi:hypothetical protein
MLACGTGNFYNLTIQIVDTTGNPQATWGTVTPAPGLQEEAAVVQLKVTPATNYGFLKWTDSAGTQLSTSNPYNFTMPGQDTTVKVVLAPAHLLTITVVDNTGTAQPTWGTVTPASGQQHPETQVIALKATATTGHTFVEWADSTGTTISTSNPYNYTMPNQDTTIRAVFSVPVPPAFTLTNYTSTQVAFPTDFQGNYIFLTFSASWCSHCQTQAGFMVQDGGVFDQLADLGITNFRHIIILIQGMSSSPATLSDAQTYAAGHVGLEYVLIDNNYATYNAYDTFLTNNGFDPNGDFGGLPSNIVLRPVGNNFECVNSLQVDLAMRLLI